MSHYSVNGPSDLRILQISDLHNNQFGNNQSRIVEVIKEENPDVIVFTGDMNYKSEIDKVEMLLQNLDLEVPMFFISGNHEEDKKTYLDDTVKMMNQYGVIHLDNEFYKVGDIYFYGLSVMDSEKLRKYKTTDEYTVALIHVPTIYKDFINKGYDVVLSGHTHGGQWRIPFMKEGLITPHKTLGATFTGGEYKVSEDTTLFVCRGLGTVT